MCSVSSGVVETLDLQRRDGIVTITLQRPHRKNAVNAVMWRELLEVFRVSSLRQEREYPAAVVIHQDDRGPQVVKFGGQQTVQVVIECEVTDDQDQRSVARGAGA